MADRSRMRAWVAGVARAGRRLGRDRVVQTSSLAPAARLALIDRGVGVAYARLAGTVRASLGAAEARAYYDLVRGGALVDPEVGRRLAVDLPTQMARVPVADRGRYFDLVEHVLREQAAAAPIVARVGPDLVAAMEPAAVRQFLERGLALHAQSASRGESFLRRESQEGQTHARSVVPGVALDGIHRMLTLYARAHCGEDLEVRAVDVGRRGSVEGRVLYLPERVVDYGDERDFLVYRVMTAHCAGYVEFGTFDLDLDTLPGRWRDRRADETEVDRLTGSFPNRSLARDLFQILEDARIEAHLRATYPGIERDLIELRAHPVRPRPDLAELSRTDQVVELVARRAIGQPWPSGVDGDVRSAALRGVGLLGEVATEGAPVGDVAAGLPALYAAAAAFLRSVDDESPPRQAPTDGDEPDPPGGPGGGGSGDGGDDDGEGDDDYEGLVLPVGSPRLGSLRDSIREIAQEIDALERTVAEAERGPPRVAPASSEEDRAAADRLRALAPDGGGLVEDSGRSAPAADIYEGRASGSEEALTEGVRYREWDHRIGDYKPDWARVVEQRLIHGDPAFVARVRAEHGPLIGQLRKRFEALRPDVARSRRGLVDGHEVDIDAAIEARTVLRAGGSPTERLYARKVPELRDVSAAFLVDLSSSTNEVVHLDGKRIIDVEKEALVCIAEALDAVGDRFAVYGFSGYGRQQVDFFVAKEFDEQLRDPVRDRIGALSWRMENRDGAAIRHCTARLLEQGSRVRILFLLSDGRPLDCGCDHYFERYAQEDTRRALQEARAKGVHPFCITVDPHGADYLESMYGQGWYTVVERVDALPARLPALYRRLTR